MIRYGQLAGFPYHAKSPKPELFGSTFTDAGLLTISRFPILESEFKSFGSGCFSDAIATKGVLYTQIQIRDEILHLINTHTQATYVSPDTKELVASLDTREEQFEILR